MGRGINFFNAEIVYEVFYSEANCTHFIYDMYSTVNYIVTYLNNFKIASVFEIARMWHQSSCFTDNILFKT
jgi:hypothetical protein